MRSKSTRYEKKDFLVHPKAFIFIDKRTGAQRFEVKADASGKMPVDEAVSMLAVHCLMRNQMPSDFRVMVSAGENLLDDLGQRAGKLIQSCPSIQVSMQLTGRQQEVFRGVQRGLSNKEIGRKLNLSERTVKFHVSALLEKFDVAGRRDLMRAAVDISSVVKDRADIQSPQMGASEDLCVGPEPRISKDRLLYLNAIERRSRA
jgi:DNA-binding CsgD family transcriptional regulator